MLTLTIVGAGACGVAALAELVTRLRYERRTDVSIRVVERDEPARGLAFGTEQEGHRLNTESRLMGLHDHEPRDYRRWLEAESAGKLDEVVYAPRRDYRVYLRHVYDAALDDARDAGIPVDIETGEVAVIEGDLSGAVVRLVDGRRFETDATLLAIGTPRARRFAELDGAPGYVESPWPSSRLVDAIDRDAPVAILGSSLSAIDALMTLLDVEHRGSILMASRDGLLPRVEIPAKEEPLERRHLTLESIHRLMRERGRLFSVVDLVRLFRREVDAATDGPVRWSRLDRRGGDAAAHLRADVAAAERHEEPFQRVLTAGRHEATAVWNLLRPLDQKRFASWIGPHYATMRFVMPLLNARRIMAAFDSGQLEVRGGVTETRRIESGFELSFEDGRAHRSPVVINATGTAMRLEEMDEPLIDDLTAKGWLMPHPAGGARVHRGSGRILSADRDAPRIYAVGQLLNGELRDTNSVWFNVESAARVVDDLLHLDEEVA